MDPSKMARRLDMMAAQSSAGFRKGCLFANASQDHAYLQRAVLQFFNDAAISGKGAS